MRFSHRSPRPTLRLGRRRLPVERGERLLDRGSCTRGCDLYLSTHAVWECPATTEPTRHCWCSIEVLAIDPAGPSLRIRSGRPGAGCVHQLPGSGSFLDAARALDSASRQASFSFSLDSGSRAIVVGRACASDGALRWLSHVEPGPGADALADETAAAGLARQAARRYGGSARPVPDEASVLDVCRRRLPIEYDGRVEPGTGP